jgi:hypothetical protein
MNKEQQKQIITEIMEEDAKDGLYEDTSHRDNPRPDDVEKLAANLANPNGDKTDNWKEGYLYAKETLYTEEQVVGFAEWIGGTYSFGNIFGKWYLLQNTHKEYTEKELFDLYIQSLKQLKK